MSDADALLEQSRFADSVKLQQQQQLQQLFRDNLRLARENAAKKEVTQYATFTYDDTDAVASEIDEIYSFHERHAFAEHARTWRAHFPAGLEWDSVGADAQDSFVADCLAAVALPPSDRTAAAAACLVHIAHGVFTEGMPQEVQLARMADEGARLCRLGAHRTIGAALAAVHGARDWAALSLLLQVLCLQCLAGRRDAAFAASLALPLPDGTTLVRTLFELLGETQEQIPKGFPFKKLILTLWRVMLVAWGDFAALPLLRDVARAEAGLPPLRQGTSYKPSLEDIADFEEQTASKFYGLERPGSPSAQASVLLPVEQTLPRPIREGLEILRRNVYISLGDVQLAAFRKQTRPPILWLQTPPRPREDDPALQRLNRTRADLRALLPLLPKYMHALLRVLLPAVPSVKKYAVTMELLNDHELLAGDGSGTTKPDASAQGLLLVAQEKADVARHREIICKAVAGLLLLLLKHAKLTHFLAFEYAARIAVDNNTILMLLRFLNQDMAVYMSTITEIAPYRFLNYCTHPREDLTESDLAQTGQSQKGPAPPAPSRRTPVAENNDDDSTGEAAASQASRDGPVPVSWRNAFAATTFVRILQKLVKNKPARIRTLLELRAQGIMERLVRLPQDRLAYYGFKIFKTLLPYLGRKWRQVHMRLVTSIYMSVTLRSSDAALLTGSDDQDMPAPTGFDQGNADIDSYVRSVIADQEAAQRAEVEAEQELALDPVFQDYYEDWLAVTGVDMDASDDAVPAAAGDDHDDGMDDGAASPDWNRSVSPPPDSDWAPEPI